MKFFIIGSNSFSGASFAKYLLDKNHKIFGVSRSEEIEDIFLPYKWEWESKNNSFSSNFQFEKADINKDLKKIMYLIDEFQPEYLINFAAQGMVAESWLNPIHWYKTNLLSQVAFHDELRQRKFLKKYIHFTTPEVYGNTEKGWVKENFNFSPTTPYAVSRASCDLHLVSFFKAYNFPVIFTRAANVFGPGQQLYRVIPRIILSCISKKTFFLHGSGSSLRSFIHINDVNNALYKILKNSDIGTSWHISTNQQIRIKELVEKICLKFELEPESIIKTSKDRLGKDPNYALCSKKIRSELNWEDKITLDEGIDATIDWIKKNYNDLKDLNWNYQHKI